MSMKYYAVTDDPNELLHYGVKGMKWGQHIFGDKPKSAGYHKARAKLSKIRSNAKKAASFAKSAIKASKQQMAVNHQKKREEKYNRAVMKAQQRVNAIEGLNALNQMQNYAKRAQTQALASNNASKLSLRQEKRYAKNEAKMDKYLQQARQGKLKYGKLSEDQVARIQDRLGLEANTRRLGSAEKTWHQQKKEARRAGKLRGIEAGTAAAMTEIAKAGAQFGVAHVIDRWKLNSASKHEGKRQHIKTRAQNKKSRSEIREDLQNEAYETQIREGDSYDWATARAGEKLKKIEAKKHEQQRIQAIQDRIRNEMELEGNQEYQKMLADKAERERVRRLNETMNNALDMAKNEGYQKLLSNQEEERFLTEESQNRRRNARQDLENEERADRALMRTARLAFEENMFDDNSGSGGGGGNKQKKGGGGGGVSSPKFKDINDAKAYFERHQRGETWQQEQARLAKEKRERDAAIAAKRVETIRLNKENAAAARRQAEQEAHMRAYEEAKRRTNSVIPTPGTKNRSEMDINFDSIPSRASNKPKVNVIKMNREAQRDLKRGTVHESNLDNYGLGWVGVRRKKRGGGVSLRS